MLKKIRLNETLKSVTFPKGEDLAKYSLVVMAGIIALTIFFIISDLAISGLFDKLFN